MTTGNFKYIDPTTISDSKEPLKKTWTKVDGPGQSFSFLDLNRQVIDLRGKEHDFTTDNAGFSIHHFPASEKAFTDDAAVRGPYYDSVEAALRKHLPDGKRVRQVAIFDHTIRRRIKDSPRLPVQQVHVDQTPAAAEVRVRRHLPAAEVAELLKGRFQIINVWRPIGNPASDFPLAVMDWRSTKPEDFVHVDLLYPKRAPNGTGKGDDDDDRGKEVKPSADPSSIDGYEVKGETFAIKPSDAHRFYYRKDMPPEEVMFIKCFDSRSETVLGEKGKGISHCTPHTAFEDPQTPPEAPGRQSIEVRCLVFYE